ncbi:ABC transporter substrate-binding protein [Bradyrhizobium sp. 521_C7_N1_3]|uniref:ABC transporter substrate-binding protein n=1 Tax=Bradyrhizobium TaxID=374 RepID=UPI002714C48C|nr:extracellular solute-binding protein [Bradyrhizobium japonicum]WLB50627.1 extracellular solute-binding protein [Bradyrhizobium japonicum]WLB67599.1 extracellular solute-binding protein [Bradyrhizobium japonicum]
MKTRSATPMVAALVGVCLCSGALAAPISLSIIDTGGDLASVQTIIENYKKANPDKVSEIKIQRAPAPELPAKIKAQQDAGRLDINLVLTGQDGGALLAQNGQLIAIPDYQKTFPRDGLTDAGKALYDEGKGVLIPSVGNAGGPVLIYNPAKVPSPPKTAQELLTWVKANPGKFMYARPANSGPGRAILQGFAFILGDSKPLDPEKGWDKSWNFLKELGKSVEYYPTGTAITLKEFAQGQRWMIAGIMEWDMKPRAQSVIPPDSKIAILENTTFVVDGHYWCIPKGVPQEQVDVIVDLMKFMWKPEQQALTWKAFIGPVVKAAALASAPKDIQDEVKEFWRPEYDQIGTKWKVSPPLGVTELSYAMERWDREVGADQVKK